MDTVARHGTFPLGVSNPCRLRGSSGPKASSGIRYRGFTVRLSRGKPGSVESPAAAAYHLRALRTRRGSAHPVEPLAARCHRPEAKMLPVTPARPSPIAAGCTRRGPSATLWGRGRSRAVPAALPAPLLPASRAFASLFSVLQHRFRVKPVRSIRGREWGSLRDGAPASRKRWGLSHCAFVLPFQLWKEDIYWSLQSQLL